MHGQPSSNERSTNERFRRRSFRVRPASSQPLFVDMATSETVLRTSVVDISVDGVEVLAIGETCATPTVGAPVKVSLQLPGSPFELRLVAQLARLDKHPWHAFFALEFGRQDSNDALGLRRELHAYVLRRQFEQMDRAKRDQDATRDALR